MLGARGPGEYGGQAILCWASASPHGQWRLNAQWRPTPANPEPAITRLLHIGFQLISTNESTVRTTHDHEKTPIDSIGKWTHGIYTEK